MGLSRNLTLSTPIPPSNVVDLIFGGQGHSKEIWVKQGS